MARILAIDYGKKRTGIAVTDELQIIANGLETVDSKLLFKFLKEYFTKEEVECVVVGYPMNLDMTKTDGTFLVDEFLEKFKQKFPTMKVETVDERFTSKIAFQTMIDSGISKKKRRDKALVDKISATVILQSYMDAKQFQGF